MFYLFLFVFFVFFFRAEDGIRDYKETGVQTCALPIFERDERVVGAIAVLLDAEGVETHELALWQRTAVRLGVLILLLTGITWVLVRWTVTRPIARMAEWTKQLKTGQPVAPPSDADASLFGPLAGEVTGLA